MSRGSPRMHYIVDVVRMPMEGRPYDGWQIEVIYDTKAGLIGIHGNQRRPVVH